MKRIAVLLSGCGVFDGSEINEAVLSLLAIASKERVTNVLRLILSNYTLLIT